MNDAELRSLLKTSPRDGHRAIFEQYANYVYTIVWSKLRGCGTKEDAEEVVSDIFAEVFRHVDAGAVGSIGGFVGTVARNRAITAFHHLRGGVQAVPLEDAAALPDGSDVETDAEAAEQRRILLDQIKALGEPDASIVFAKYFHGRNAREIARMLDMTPAAVRQRLHRAVRKLRTLLEEAGLGR